MTNIPSDLTPAEIRQLRALIQAVEAHLSAYSPSDEMSETDQEMSDALVRLWNLWACR